MLGGIVHIDESGMSAIPVLCGGGSEAGPLSYGRCVIGVNARRRYCRAPGFRYNPR
jgi:hypothetical protein